MSDEILGFDDLSVGDGVLVRFESKWNKEATQTIAGVVADHSDTHNKFAEVVVTDGSENYLVTWDGGVARRAQRDNGAIYWDDYGVSARMWALEPVYGEKGIEEELLDDEELSEHETRAADPLIPPTEDEETQ